MVTSSRDVGRHVNIQDGIGILKASCEKDAYFPTRGEMGVSFFLSKNGQIVLSPSQPMCENQGTFRISEPIVVPTGDCSPFPGSPWISIAFSTHACIL